MFRKILDIFKLRKQNKPEFKTSPVRLSYQDINNMFRYEDFLGKPAIKIDCCTFGLIRTSTESIETEQQVYITDFNQRTSQMTITVRINGQADIMYRYIRLWETELNSNPDFTGVTINMDDIFIINNAKLKYISHILSDTNSLISKYTLVIETGFIIYNKYARELKQIDNDIEIYSSIIKAINNSLSSDALFRQSDISIILSSRQNNISQSFKDKQLLNHISSYCKSKIKQLNKKKFQFK